MSKNINLKELLIGTDFEMFVVNTTGKFVSAIPYIDGTKSEPQPVSAQGHFIQHDGVLAEFNCPPLDIESGEEMWKNIQFVMEEGQKRLPENLSIKCCTNGAFEDDELTDAEARIAGCSASYQAWDNANIAPKPDFGVINDRCAGLHWHFTWPGCELDDAMRLIRLLDGYLAVPFLFIDEDRKRRLLYGRLGDFRFKNYGDVNGIEYRVLSNVMLKNRETFDWGWSQIKKALEEYNKGTDFLPYKDRFEQAVNHYDLDQAEQICDEFGIQRLVEEELDVYV